MIKTKRVTYKDAIRKRDQWRKAADKSHGLNKELRLLLDNLTQEEFRKYSDDCYGFTREQIVSVYGS